MAARLRRPSQTEWQIPREGRRKGRGAGVGRAGQEGSSASSVGPPRNASVILLRRADTMRLRCNMMRHEAYSVRLARRARRGSSRFLRSGRDALLSSRTPRGPPRSAAPRAPRPLLAAVAAGWLATLSEGLAPRPCSLRVHEFIEEALAGGRPTHSLGSAACVLDSDTGFTPLHEAANRGGIRAGALVEAFMDAFAWVREVDNQGATALHIAAQSGQTVAAAALCGAAEKEGELPSLLNQMDENGASALDLAEANDHVGVARILVRRGGRRGSAPPEVQCSAELLDAMLLNDAALAASLLSSDAQKAQTCLAPPIALGRTLLHHAVAVSTFLGPPEGLDVIRTLLSYGANSSLPDAAGETPLAVAAGGDRGDVVMVLLESPEVKIDAQDGLGRTALHQASRAGAQRSRHESSRRRRRRCSRKDTSGRITATPCARMRAPSQAHVHACARTRIHVHAHAGTRRSSAHACAIANLYAHVSALPPRRGPPPHC